MLSHGRFVSRLAGLLLAFVEPRVVACVVPGHEKLLEVFIFDCTAC